MRERVGELWIGLGVLHLGLIAVLARDDLAGILRAGYVDGVGDDANRSAAFWLFYLGVPFLLVGVVLRWAQRVTGTVPESVSWLALVAFVLGALAVPASGFWLGVALAGYGIVVARRDRRDAAAGARPRVLSH